MTERGDGPSGERAKLVMTKPILIDQHMNDLYPPAICNWIEDTADFLSRQPERETTGCPCTVEGIEPCSSACSCANSIMSGGCQRCARYGSLEQRKKQAQYIVDALKPHQPEREAVLNAAMKVKRFRATGGKGTAAVYEDSGELFAAIDAFKVAPAAQDQRDSAGKVNADERSSTESSLPEGALPQATGETPTGRMHSAESHHNAAPQVESLEVNTGRELVPSEVRQPAAAASCPCGVHWEFCTRGTGCEKFPTAAAPREAGRDGCKNCRGAGTIKAMTQHLGPDDYEEDITCPACDGTGVAPAAPDMVLVPREALQLINNAKDLLWPGDAQELLQRAFDIIEGRTITQSSLPSCSSLLNQK